MLAFPILRIIDLIFNQSIQSNNFQNNTLMSQNTLGLGIKIEGWN